MLNDSVVQQLMTNFRVYVGGSRLLSKILDINLELILLRKHFFNFTVQYNTESTLVFTRVLTFCM
jgi:hypothetical protein